MTVDAEVKRLRHEVALATRAGFVTRTVNVTDLAAVLDALERAGRIEVAARAVMALLGHNTKLVAEGEALRAALDPQDATNEGDARDG